MKPANYTWSIAAPARHAVLLFTLLAACSGDQILGRESGPSDFMYFADAHGRFTLEMPPKEAGYLLALKGTCALPEIMLQVRKRNSAGPARTVSYRTGGRKNFSLTYLIKDGAGEYNLMIYGKKSVSDRALKGLCSFSVRSTREMPKNFRGLYVNDLVLRFAKGAAGKTIGSGECWDLAQEALDYAGADWNREFIFGELHDMEKDRVAAGDIIQFRSVRIQRTLPDGGTLRQVIGNPDHTAIILSVEGKNIYRISHQNSDGKRFVITSTVNLNEIKSGSFRIYRPVAGVLH